MIGLLDENWAFTQTQVMNYIMILHDEELVFSCKKGKPIPPFTAFQ